MPATVTLTVLEGSLGGQQFVFTERTTCILGRVKDCQPRFPGESGQRTVSRHHCRLDVNPPAVCIRDLGSRNGTFINGEKIGQRPKSQSAEDGALLDFPERDLTDGQEIRLGKKVRIVVRIAVPAACADCGCEIPENEKDSRQLSPRVFQCEACRQKAASLPQQLSPSSHCKVCAQCGKDVTQEKSGGVGDEYVCASCRKDPLGIVKSLLELAWSRSRELGAIEGYQVEKELGRGGMGVVYLARHEDTGEQVALKVMLPDVALNSQNKKRFLREINSTHVLDHPNVVRLRGAGTSRGICFLTMEYCEGGSLEELRQRRGGTLPVEEAGAIILQVLEGLNYAHKVAMPAVRMADGSSRPARGLVHRDLKPHNIFLGGRGGQTVAKVGDFGLAKAFDVAGLSGMTIAGMVAGTPMFMPRQQAVDFRFSEPAVDVWAVAASLYYLLTGSPPRHFAKNKDKWWVILETAAVPIHQRDPAIPKRLAQVIDRALVDEPEMLFKSAAELADALRGVLR